MYYSKIPKLGCTQLLNVLSSFQSMEGMGTLRDVVSIKYSPFSDVNEI